MANERNWLVFTFYFLIDKYWLATYKSGRPPIRTPAETLYFREKFDQLLSITQALDSAATKINNFNDM
jgi:hypothetical protein